jgi:xanthine dehydrogenase small subunit
MRTPITFVLDGKIVAVNCRESGISPTTTVLNYLRSLPHHAGVKEGCAEGDCGACTVVLGELSGEGIRYRAVDSCLIFLPMLHGKQLITVENLKTPAGDLHPVQQAMVERYGSQCGFCTPGVVMSLFALYKNCIHPTEAEVRRSLAGNLCRCTGYTPIVEAAMLACGPGRAKEISGDDAQLVALLRGIRAGSAVFADDRQTYYRPATVAEALDLKQLHPEVVVTNGATDVALRVTKNHEILPVVLDLSGIDSLRGWSEADGEVIVGAGTSIEDFAELCGERFPALAAMLGVFGSLQIRNLATVGGNIGTASPVGDLMPVLIAHEARIVLRGRRGERCVPASQFVTGYRRTDVASDELITAVVLPPVHRGTILRSYKVSRRQDVDIATVSGGFRIELEDSGRISTVILAYGGMADRVRRAERAEAFLRGKEWSRPTVEEAMHVLDTDFDPISDVRGSAVMRKLAARNLLLKFWAESGVNGGEPWQ